MNPEQFARTSHKNKLTILIKSGRLRRGTSFSAIPGVTHVINNAPYAAANNRGFDDVVHVLSHTHRLMASKTIETGRY